jgi:hypothetical protein
MLLANPCYTWKHARSVSLETLPKLRNYFSRVQLHNLTWVGPNVDE